jgi:hypothetical protein
MPERDTRGVVRPLAVIVGPAVAQPARHGVDGGFGALGTQAMVDETYDAAHRMKEGEPPCKGAISGRAIVPQACSPTSYRPTAQRRLADYVRPPWWRTGKVNAAANT